MNRRIRGYRNKKQGEAGEIIARYALQALGLEAIHRIHTPFKIVEIVKRLTGGLLLARIVPEEKVAGDFNATHPGTGKRVIIEVKTADEETLIYSRLQKNQHDALAENITLGGISLIVWIQYNQAHVIRYEDAQAKGFKPRGSIKSQDLPKLAITEI